VLLSAAAGDKNVVPVAFCSSAAAWRTLEGGLQQQQQQQ
jgi:hypothetical protein